MNLNPITNAHRASAHGKRRRSLVLCDRCNKTYRPGNGAKAKHDKERANARTGSR